MKMKACFIYVVLKHMNFTGMECCHPKFLPFFSLFAASSLVHLCRLRDPETQRLSLQTLELLAIENSDVIIQHVTPSIFFKLFLLPRLFPILKCFLPLSSSLSSSSILL